MIKGQISGTEQLVWGHCRTWYNAYTQMRIHKRGIMSSPVKTELFSCTFRLSTVRRSMDQQECTVHKYNRGYKAHLYFSCYHYSWIISNTLLFKISIIKKFWVGDVLSWTPMYSSASDSDQNMWCRRRWRQASIRQPQNCCSFPIKWPRDCCIKVMCRFRIQWLDTKVERVHLLLFFKYFPILPWGEWDIS